MKHLYRPLVLALLAVIMPCFGLTSGGLPPAALATSGIVQIDPNLPIHPYLQYGASVEPTRRVRVIVQKTSPLVSSPLIARAVGTTVAPQ